jgi:hypothetical protein
MISTRGGDGIREIPQSEGRGFPAAPQFYNAKQVRLSSLTTEFTGFPANRVRLESLTYADLA